MQERRAELKVVHRSSLLLLIFKQTDGVRNENGRSNIQWL